MAQDQSNKTKPARPPKGKPAAPAGKKPAGPPGAKKPAGPPSAKLPPGFSSRKKKKRTRSEVEEAKDKSDYLYDDVPQRLVSDVDHFEEEQEQVLKHFGIYQQDDRDLRKQIDGKHYYFFVRSKLPGGKLTAEQYLVHDRLADDYGIGSIRITTRQGIQIHGMVKKDLQKHIQELNEILVTTLGACGDVVRNTMCCPAPIDDPVRREIQVLAEEVSDFTMPRTKAYHDIWLKSYDEQAQAVETLKKVHDGKESNGHTVEPLYGKTYLPRKFKIGFAYPGDNCVDVFTHDVGFIPIVEDGQLEGFNVLVGGGLGNTHNKPNTFPRLGDVLGYVEKGEVLGVLEHIIGIQRDHGNRLNRKNARLKYLIADWGIDKFHDEVAERWGRHLEAPREVPDFELDLHLGWHPQGDGRYYLGVSVENGRVVDNETMQLKSAFKKVVETFRPGVRLTPNHDILFTDLKETDRAGVEAILKNHGVLLPEELTRTQKFAMACPALPTCGLALAESERIFPEIIDELEVEIAKLGLDRETLAIRMTGCPNGCARPYVADIGIVGQSLDKYKIYVGGTARGTRLNEGYEELVATEDIVGTIRPLLHAYKKHRTEDESFGDFCHRLGVDELKSLTQSVEANGTLR